MLWCLVLVRAMLCYTHRNSSHLDAPNWELSGIGWDAEIMPTTSNVRLRMKGFPLCSSSHRRSHSPTLEHAACACADDHILRGRLSLIDADGAVHCSRQRSDHLQERLAGGRMKDHGNRSGMAFPEHMHADVQTKMVTEAQARKHQQRSMLLYLPIARSPFVLCPDRST